MWLKLIPYIQKIVWAVTVLVTVLLYKYITRDGAGVSGHVQEFAQIFGKLAFGYLLVTLFISPIYILFPRLPAKALFVKARKAIGTSAFFFAVLHMYFGFFGLLGGFAGLYFLGPKYLTATILGTLSLLILTVLAVTSLTYLVRKLGKRWKLVHRFVYAAALLVPIHALLIGSDFNDPNNLIGDIFLLATLVLLLLEEIRIYKHVTAKYTRVPKRMLAGGLAVIFIGVYYVVFFSSFLRLVA